MRDTIKTFLVLAFIALLVLWGCGDEASENPTIETETTQTDDSGQIDDMGGIGLVNTAPNSDYVILDAFDYDAIPVVRPDFDEGDPLRYQWYHDNTNNAEDERPGEVTLTPNSLYGRNCISVTNTLPANNPPFASMFLVFYNYDGTNYEWRYLEESISAGTWQHNHFNRLRFWVKAAPEIEPARVRNANFHVGTYVRGSAGGRNSGESGGGGHYYHYYNIPPTGEWHRVIVDMHPNHRRGDNGSIEQGHLQYPVAEDAPELNYFDLMTYFYVTFINAPAAHPLTTYVDGFELYSEPNVENEEQVYGINGVYRPSDNLLIVGWNRNKNEDHASVEVRYAFSSIHDLGYDNATLAPSNQADESSGNPFVPPGQGGYNTIEYRSDQIDVTGQAAIFVAVQPQENNPQGLFKQIRIPVLKNAEGFPVLGGR